MYEPDVQFRMDLFENALADRRLSTIHWMYAQGQARQAIRLIKERRWEIERGSNAFHVFVRWPFRHKAVFNARIMTLVQAGISRHLFLTRSPILPREKQEGRIEFGRHY